MIDVHVYVSRWPFRRLPLDETAKLVRKLREEGVAQAWAGSFDAVLHENVAGINARLAEECKSRGEGLLVPFGTVNPTLPDWEEDLRRCAEAHQMPGIRLHPNYHGYQLDDPRFARLLAVAAERKLIVQIAVRMEDPRTQHPLVQAADVDCTPLVELLPKHPQAKIVLLSALSHIRQDLADKLAAAGAFFDIAYLEGVAGIERALKTMPLAKLLFGSYAPYYVWESAKLKLKESAIGRAQAEAIAGENAKGMAKL
ncbi:MAG TPA: amidohydrolase family protein [Pirellulaceae bacterium]|nr:amidohydrolase family protein [Pirellulaceae bacterium]